MEEVFDKIYLVKIYLNKELIYVESYTDLEKALQWANFWEDKDYICEVLIYESTKCLERSVWRNAKVDI